MTGETPHQIGARVRRTYRRVGRAHSVVFMVAALAYGTGDVPILALPCAFVSGWVWAQFGSRGGSDV